MNKIAVILGIYKNPAFLPVSVKAIKEQKVPGYEVDIFVYDNSEDPNTLKSFEKKFPYVKVKRNKVNNGFAGGNNSVIREVLKDPLYKYLVVLNDDTKPEKNSLNELVKTADKNEKAGAVATKLVFFEDFVSLTGSLDTSKDPKSDIKIYIDKSGFKESTYPKRFIQKGIFGIEEGSKDKYCSTSNEFEIYFPIGEKTTSKNYNLKLQVRKLQDSKDQGITLKIASLTKKFILKKDVEELEIKIPATAIKKAQFTVIQNASCKLNKHQQLMEIGNGEIDRGQYDKPLNDTELCGAGVLFRADTLRQVGIFDGYLFMYYEDTDLNLRIKRKGWTIPYQPKAVVRHYHTFSSVEWSPLFYYYVIRNTVVFVMKNFGFKEIYQQWRHLGGEIIRHTMWVSYKGANDKEAKQRLSALIRITFDLIIHTPMIYLKRFEIIKTN